MSPNDGLVCASSDTTIFYTKYYIGFTLTFLDNVYVYCFQKIESLNFTQF